MKWDTSRIEDNIKTYIAMTNTTWKSDIIVWPETAISIPKRDVKQLLNKLNAYALKHHTTLITGIPIIKQNFAPYQLYNSLITLGDGYGTYKKRKLVPFGEYIPLSAVFDNMMQFLQLGGGADASTYVPGPYLQAPISADHIKLATFICYETAFPELVRDSVQGADALLAISDDGWFGRSVAPYQHLQMTQMRALETGRYFMFSTNNAITAIISPKGKIVKAIPPYKRAILHGVIFAMHGTTPWLKFGMWPFWIMIILMLGYSALQQRRRTRPLE